MSRDSELKFSENIIWATGSNEVILYFYNFTYK